MNENLQVLEILHNSNGSMDIKINRAGQIQWIRDCQITGLPDFKGTKFDPSKEVHFKTIDNPEYYK